MTDQEMTYMHKHTTMIGDILARDAYPLNDRLPLKLPLEPFEGMEFTSIEDVQNNYERYARNKGCSFRMGCVAKSRSGRVIGRKILCFKEWFRTKKKN